MINIICLEYIKGREYSLITYFTFCHLIKCQEDVFFIYEGPLSGRNVESINANNKVPYVGIVVVY